MKHLKIYSITGILFVSLLGSLSHFIYGWSHENIIAAMFCPVNESTWEHMKLLFFPMLLYTLLFFRTWKTFCPHSVSSLSCGILVGTYSIPVLFYTYTGILGYHTLFLDIMVFLAAVFLAFLTSYRLTFSCRITSYLPALFLICTMLAFFLFTFSPPQIGLFADPLAS